MYADSLPDWQGKDAPIIEAARSLLDHRAENVEYESALVDLIIATLNLHTFADRHIVRDWLELPSRRQCPQWDCRAYYDLDDGIDWGACPAHVTDETAMGV